ncbi:MAG: hypothetical protein WC139_12145 [Candidatus Kapaibacterium sp.]
MNKKIKSIKDIHREINALFLNIVDKNDLTKRVEIFINGITGKELMSKEEIKDYLMYWLFYYFMKDGKRYYDKININKLLPFNNFIKNRSKNFLDQSTDRYESTLCYDIIESTYGMLDPEYKYNYLTKEVFLKDIKLDKELEKLYKFLLKYASVDSFIYYLIKDRKRRFLVSLIKNNLASLSSIFYFFNDSKDLRENREYFYKLLDGKFSRHTIQLAIQRELKNIRAGKFRYYRA